MRTLALLAGLATLSLGQTPEDVKISPRYNVPGNHRLFPQASAKDALASAIKAVEAGRYEYLVAHILEESFVEAKITERAKQQLAAADADLRDRRERHRANLSLPKAEQLPDDPLAFRQAVEEEARLRGFKQVVQDVKDKLADDPTLLKDLKRFAREGEFGGEGPAVKATLKDVKDRSVTFKTGGGRFFLENQTADAPPAPKAADPGK